ncbi:MAG: helix-turn-helix domain-containing protein [Actinoallomurus sp.]
MSDGDDAYGATIAKRRLSRILTRLRGDTGMTASHIDDRLTWGRGKLGRFEANTWRRPELSDIRDLLRIYHAPDEVKREVEELAALARERAWWRGSAYKDVFEDGDEFPGYESDASIIKTCMPLVLPGLLQTEAYARAHMSVGPRDEDWIERAIAGRLRRQDILERPDTAPTLIAVITEASLRYRWGEPADRREQIDHLIKASERPTVELSILRFEDGPHPGMSSLINIFHYPYADEPAITYLETDTKIMEVSSSEYLDLFERIRHAAAPPAESAAFLTRLAEQLE